MTKTNTPLKVLGTKSFLINTEVVVVIECFTPGTHFISVSTYPHTFVKLLMSIKAAQGLIQVNQFL